MNHLSSCVKLRKSEGRNSLKNHHEQRYFRTEHTWWPHWSRRTSRRSVTGSTEVQMSRLSKASNSAFCKLPSRKHKVFIVNTYTCFQYFSTWHPATFTTSSTIMIWVGFLRGCVFWVFLSKDASHFLVKTALAKVFRTLTNHLPLIVHA